MELFFYYFFFFLVCCCMLGTSSWGEWGLLSTCGVQFSRSVVSILCDTMDCSTPGLPDHRQLPEFTQTHVCWVGDAIQPSRASHVAEHGVKAPWVRGSRVRTQQLQYMGLVVSWHMESCGVRNGNCVPYHGRQILNHWTTREVLHGTILIHKLVSPVLSKSITLVFGIAKMAIHSSTLAWKIP